MKGDVSSMIVGDCNNVLQELLAAHTSTWGAVMAQVDGRAFAAAFRSGNDVEAPRIAAIASSLLGLSESFTNEALKAKARYNSIVTEQGCIVTVRVPSVHRAHVLCLWADDSETFAMILRAALDTAGKLARIVDGGG